MRRFLPWLLGCLALAALIFAVWITLVSQDSADINHWHRVTQVFNHSDGWLAQCQPQEVRMQWSEEEGWIDNLTIDLKAKAISGGSGNGISFSAPFALVATPEKPRGPTLTDDEVALIKDTLARLPPGESSLDSTSDFSHDFRVAFYQDGGVQVRHYPGDHMPAPLVQLGKTLHLLFPH